MLFRSLFTGLYAHDVRASYIFETITILLTAILIPSSLKAFSYILKRQINNQSTVIAIKKYFLWSLVRLLLLFLIIIVGLSCYFLTLSSTGALCALMGITASLFCIPSEEKLKKEIHLV